MKRLTEYVVGYAHGRPGRTIEAAEASDDLCRGEFECSGLIDKLAIYENIGTPDHLNELAAAKKDSKLAEVSKIAEILVNEGGYEITCKFCNYSCDSQVSGLTCLHGVVGYLSDALKVYNQDSDVLYDNADNPGSIQL